MKSRPTIVKGALVRWLQGAESVGVGVVVDLPNGRSVRVKFDGGDEAVFAPSTEVLQRVEYPTGHVVRVLEDGAVARIVDRTLEAGFFVYRVATAAGEARLVPETGLRSDAALRAIEAVRDARARKDAEVVAQIETARRRKEATRAAAKAAEEASRAAREAEARAQAERKRRFLDRLREGLLKDYLGSDELVNEALAMGVSRDEFDHERAVFVQGWVERELREPIDLQQAAAVAAIGGDIKVVARAGSGKTRTLTTRAIFLQRHCGVSPREILLLAFNRKAAREMRDRMAPVVGDDPPHAMTFHALAHALVHPDEELLFDDRQTAQLGLSREIQEVIDDHIRSDEYHDRIRELMLAHFRDDWEHITERGIQLSISDFVDYRRSLPRESLKGDYVKSFGEREIANALFEHDVTYYYERNERWGGQNYRPDFVVPMQDGGVVVEYFGLEGDPDYDSMSEAKREYWRGRDGWTLVEYPPRDLAKRGVDGFRWKLIADLEGLGVATRRKNEEEIWQAVRVRAVTTSPAPSGPSYLGRESST